MDTLFDTYTLKEIILFIILLAGAYKGGTMFLDWYKERNKTGVLKSLKPEELEQTVQENDKRIQTQLQEVERRQEQENSEIKEEIAELAGQMSSLADKVDLLIDSDRDDIKAWITSQYHFFVEEQQWIDDYSLDCLEKRYVHYKNENGNSFIEDLMKEIRQLPKHPLN